MKQRSTKERRLQLEGVVKMYKQEFEALLFSDPLEKSAIKIFVDKYIRPVIDYKKTTYYLDIFFSIRRVYYSLFHNKSEMENNIKRALDQPPPSKDEIIAALPVYAAVDRLKMALMEDNGLHATWKAGIAGSFYNAIEKYCNENGLRFSQHYRELTLSIAETAAGNFINQLCTAGNSKKD